MGLLSWAPWDPWWLRIDNYIDAMAMLRRESVRAVGGYTTNEALYGWEDFELWCNMASRGMSGTLVPELVATYRAGAPVDDLADDPRHHGRLDRAARPLRVPQGARVSDDARSSPQAEQAAAQALDRAAEAGPGSCSTPRPARPRDRAAAALAEDALRREPRRPRPAATPRGRAARGDRAPRGRARAAPAVAGLDPVVDELEDHEAAADAVRGVGGGSQTAAIKG